MEPPTPSQTSLYAHLYFTGITPSQIAENLESIRKQVIWQKSNQLGINQTSSSSQSLTWTSGQTYQQTGPIGNPGTPAAQNNVSTGNPGLARHHPWLQTREQYAAHMATLHPGQTTNGRNNQQYSQDCNIYPRQMQPGLMMPAQNSGNIASGPMGQPIEQNQYYQQRTSSELEHERMMTPNQLLQQMAKEQGTSNQTVNQYPLPKNDPMENRNQQMPRTTSSPPVLQYQLEFQLEVQKCQQANRSAGINLTGRVSPIPYVTTDQLSLLMTQYPQLIPQHQLSPQMGREQYSPYRTDSSDDSGNFSMASPTQQFPNGQLQRASSPSQVIYHTSPFLRSLSNPTPPKFPDGSTSIQFHKSLGYPGPVRRCQTDQEALSSELRSTVAPYNIRTNSLGSTVQRSKNPPK